MFVKYVIIMCISLMELTTCTGTSLPERCYVKYDGPIIDINCPNSNITSLPTRPPRFVSKVFLQQNRIQSISDLSGFVSMHTLNLSHNLITTFAWQSLKHTQKLYALDLSHNQLTSVRLDVVLNWPPFLYNVDVSYNRLATFSVLNLENPSLDATKFLNPKRRGFRYIHGNPIHCDCRMLWLAEAALAFHQCWPLICTSAVTHGLLSNDFLVNGFPKCNSPEILHDVPLHRANLTACLTKEEKMTKTQLSIVESATDRLDISVGLQPNDRNQSKSIGQAVSNITQHITVFLVHGDEHKVTNPYSKNDIGHKANKEAINISAAISGASGVVLVFIIGLAVVVVTKQVIKNGKHHDGSNQNVEVLESSEGSRASPELTDTCTSLRCERDRDSLYTPLSLGQDPISPQIAGTNQSNPDTDIAVAMIESEHHDYFTQQEQEANYERTIANCLAEQCRRKSASKVAGTNELYSQVSNNQRDSVTPPIENVLYERNKADGQNENVYTPLSPGLL